MCLGGMVWFKDRVMVGCQDTYSYENEIRVYPSDKNLDAANLLYTEKFERVIVLVNILHNHLLVYTADNLIHHFIISWDKMSMSGTTGSVSHQLALKMTKLKIVSLEGVVAAPFSVQYLDWFIPLMGEDPDITVQISPFLLLQEGKLSIVDEFEVPKLARKGHLVFMIIRIPKIGRMKASPG